MKKIGLKMVEEFFSFGFNSIDTNDTLYIHKYLIKRTWNKTIFKLVKKIFTVVLSSIANPSDHTKCISLTQICYVRFSLLL